jgi:hypothetical protein
MFSFSPLLFFQVSQGNFLKKTFSDAFSHFHSPGELRTKLQPKDRHKSNQKYTQQVLETNRKMFQPKKEFRKLGLRFREKAQPHESAVHSTQSQRRHLPK